MKIEIDTMLKIISRKKLYNEIKSLLDNIQADFGGGCGVEKAFVIAWLIGSFRMKNTVDIGVYRGRSFFPQALAHRKFTGGKVYGVDPWNKLDAAENDNIELKDQINEFIEKTNFNAIFQEVSSFREKNNFGENSVIVRDKSENAAYMFSKRNLFFNLIHIDGNHDTDFAVKDVNLYLPLLNKNGFVILDDISWDSVKPAMEILNRKTKLLIARSDRENDYAIYWNNKSLFLSKIMGMILKYWVKCNI